MVALLDVLDVDEDERVPEAFLDGDEPVPLVDIVNSLALGHEDNEFPFEEDNKLVVPDRDRCVQSVECDVDKEDLVAPGIVVLDEVPVVENNVE